MAIATFAFAFAFTGEALESIDETGRVHVEVQGLYKAVPDRASGGVKHLLDQVNLVFEPGDDPTAKPLGGNTFFDLFSNFPTKSSGQALRVSWSNQGLTCQRVNSRKLT